MIVTPAFSAFQNGKSFPLMDLRLIFHTSSVAGTHRIEANEANEP